MINSFESNAEKTVWTCSLKADPFLKKCCKWNVVNILSYFLILLHSPDILGFPWLSR